MPDNYEKVKAFAARIVQECEQEGLTVTEALMLPQELRFAIEKCVLDIQSVVKLKASQVGR